MRYFLKKKIVIFSFLFLCVSFFSAIAVFADTLAFRGDDAARNNKVELRQIADKEDVSSNSGGEKKSFLNITGNVVFWNLVTFAILVFILGKYGWKPIIKALDDRAARIKEDIDRAEKDREKSSKLLIEKQELIAKAYKDSKGILSKAKDDAQKVSGELIAQAQKDSQDIITKAHKEIELAKNKALLDLKEELGIISLDIASKVISKSINLSDHKSLIMDALSRYESKN